MKIYKGKKRIAFKRWDKRYLAELQTLAQLKIGDFIHTCEGFNRRITDIQYEWDKKGRRSSVLCDIQFTDSNGRWHWASGLGCVSLPISNEEIYQYHMGWLNNTQWPRFAADAQRLKDLRNAGQPYLSKMENQFRTNTLS